MRVSLTIDDELAQALEDLAERTNKPLEQVANEILRAGLGETGVRLSRPYKVKPASLGGVSPGIDLDRPLALADAIEDQDIRMRRREGSP